MKIQGITFGVGTPWDRVAAVAASQMQKMTGVECHVITSRTSKSHPSWEKCRAFQYLPKADVLVVFDADIFCLRPWSPLQMWQKAGRRLCLVHEPPNALTQNECRLYGLDANSYCNGGLYIAGKKEDQNFLESVREDYWPQYGSWLEQTGLNKHIQLKAHPIAPLPLIYNQLVNAPLEGEALQQRVTTLRRSPCVNAHFAGRGNNISPILELFKLLAKQGKNATAPRVPKTLYKARCRKN